MVTFMGKVVDVSTFQLCNCSSQALAQCRTTVQKDYGKQGNNILVFVYFVAEESNN